MELPKQISNSHLCHDSPLLFPMKLVLDASIQVVWSHNSQQLIYNSLIKFKNSSLYWNKSSTLARALHELKLLRWCITHVDVIHMHSYDEGLIRVRNAASRRDLFGHKWTRTGFRFWAHFSIYCLLWKQLTWCVWLQKRLSFNPSGMLPHYLAFLHLQLAAWRCSACKHVCGSQE